MKKVLALLFLIIISFHSGFGWGKTGHRVVGQIAYDHLTAKAKKNLTALLGNEHLNMIGNYMDFIRADSTKDYMTPWHYCTIPEGMTYEQAGIPETSDAIQAIIRIIGELKSKKFTYDTEIDNLKYLVHIVSDVHQPLHVGTGEDMGGNDVKVNFMWESSNLHRVWDSGMIDHQQLSFTEYAQWIDHASEDQIKSWQKDDLMIWIDEALGYRAAIYDLPEDGKLRYDYNYAHIATVNERLLKAGIRLAGILNEIYG